MAPHTAATKHEAQRIYPAAMKVAQSRGLRVLQRELGKSQKGAPSFETLHSCAATLEDENTAHDEALETAFFRSAVTCDILFR